MIHIRCQLQYTLKFLCTCALGFVGRGLKNIVAVVTHAHRFFEPKLHHWRFLTRAVATENTTAQTTVMASLCIHTHTHAHTHRRHKKDAQDERNQRTPEARTPLTKNTKGTRTTGTHFDHRLLDPFIIRQRPYHNCPRGITSPQPVHGREGHEN